MIDIESAVKKWSLLQQKFSRTEDNFTSKKEKEFFKVYTKKYEGWATKSQNKECSESPKSKKKSSRVQVVGIIEPQS